MTSTCPAWEFVADNYLLKFQRLQNKDFLHDWKFFKAHSGSRFVRPYIYNYIRKLCRQQAEVIQNHENANVRNTGQGARNIRRLNLAAVKRTTVQVTGLLL
jgi:hypothetical protein